MKTTILIIAAIVITLNRGIAQEIKVDSRNKLVFGLKAGTNYANVYDREGKDFNADPKFGWAAGAFVSIPIGRIIGLQPEVLFSQKGFKSTGSILGETYDLTRTSNYLDIPLLFALKPTDYLSILAGPQFSYLMKQKDEFANTSTSIAQEQEFKNDNIRKNTLCFLGGIDLNFNHFLIGARAGWDLQTNRGDGSSTTPRYKNMWYQATIGFRFYGR